MSTPEILSPQKDLTKSVKFSDFNTRRVFDSVLNRLTGQSEKLETAFKEKTELLNLPPNSEKGNRALKDALLYLDRTKGKLCFANRLMYETNIFNTADIFKRQNLQVLREYWLGKGDEFPEVQLKRCKTDDDIFNLISEKLIKDIVNLVLDYKNNKDITPLKKREDKHGRPINYIPELFRDKFNRNFEGSTYAYNLILTLVEGGDPRKLNIPYASLSPDELTEIEKRIKEAESNQSEFESLKEEYKAKFGKNPPANIKLENLKEKLKGE